MIFHLPHAVDFHIHSFVQIIIKIYLLKEFTLHGGIRRVQTVLSFYDDLMANSFLPLRFIDYYFFDC